MAYQYTDYSGYGNETDEETRKRRAMIMAGLSPDSGIGDIASNMFTNRLTQAKDTITNAGQLLTNPEEELKRRMGFQPVAPVVPTEQQVAMQAQPLEQQLQQYRVAQEEPTPVKQTITTNPETGEQKIKIEGSARDLSSANPLTPTVVSPVAPSQLEARTMVPSALASQGPINPNQPMPVIGQPPMPGPATQFAGNATAGAMNRPAPYVGPSQGAEGQTIGQQMIRPISSVAPPVAPAPAPAPAPASQGTPFTPTAEREVIQPKLWVQAANDAGSDFGKLLDVAAKHPESRAMIQGKMELLVKNKSKEDEANAIITAAQAGDLKATNKAAQALKPETGKPKEEVTVNDFLRMIMYRRLGAEQMALDIENKIRGKDTKFGQISFGGSNWETETDSTGRIVRAKDDEGTIATESTLNKLRAGGVKAGTQATAFTGGIHTVPNAAGTGQDLVMPTQNSITGQAGFTYATGPNKGREYVGTATPQPQSVGTSFQKALDKAMIDFRTAPSIAAAKAAREKAAILDPGDNSLNRMVDEQIQRMAPDIFNQLGTTGTTSTTQVDTAAVDRLDRTLAENQREIDRTSKSTAVTPQRKQESLKILNDERNKLLAQRQSMGGTSGTGGGKMPGGSLAQQESTLKTNQAVSEARLKPPATKEGEIEAQKIQNQNTANENYGMIKDVADLIKQSTGSGLGTRVDTLAGFFGVGTKGADAIAKLNVMSYPFIYNIPRFEGPQGEKDVTIYEKAAGDFANPKLPVSQRLAALQGMVYLLKKYDKEGKNDWTFGGQDPTKKGSTEKTNSGTTSSGNKYKKVE